MEINNKLEVHFDRLSKDLESVRRENECLKSRIGNLEKKLAATHSNSRASPNVSPRKPLYARKSSVNIVNRNETAKAPAPAHVSYDPCEVLICGVSALSRLHPLQIIQQILTFANLASILTQVTSTRCWKGNSNKNGTTSAFVVKFSSPAARDAFINGTRNLKHLNLSNVFSYTNGTQIKMSIMNLIPKPTFLLLMKARKAHKLLGYAPPLVKRGVVYMRKSVQAPLFAIHSEEDLAQLKST